MTAPACCAWRQNGSRSCASLRSSCGSRPSSSWAPVEGLVEELATLVRAHPYRERFWRLLMLALYRVERQADALAAYQRARSVLVEELGLEPSEQLRELEQAILRQEVPPPRPPQLRHNLPSPATSFVGRAAELAEVETLLAEGRLVTLTGVGGVGKTRLALETASRLLPDFADGVFWCDLSALSEPGARASLPSRVPSTFANRRRPVCSRTWPRGYARRRCCFCWTTASICATPAPSSRKRCSRPARGCGSSRPVVSRSAPSARPTTRYRRSAARRPPESRGSFSPRMRSRSSSPAHGRHGPASSPTMLRSQRRGGSVQSWTGCRSRSSWPRRARRRCHSRRSRRGLPTGSASSSPGGG